MTVKILLVEDDKVTASLVSGYVTKAGYACALANDGVEALERLEQESFDIILLDRVMPNMDGTAFMKNIRNDSRYNTIPVIMQTVLADPPQVVEGASLGIYYYLTKPYTEDLLLSVIRAAWDHIKHQQKAAS